MVIGPTNSGKTTLVHALNDDEGTVRKTQDIIYGRNTIDVPGSYIENAWMYKHLIAASQNASHILILVDQSRCAEVYSPGFARVFRCPVIGIISKSDLMPENEDICVRQLKKIGVGEPYYKISNQDGTGIRALKKCLFEDKAKQET
jgi:ethanolamine utilization protein EutP